LATPWQRHRHRPYVEHQLWPRSQTSAQCCNAQVLQPAAHSFTRGEARMASARLQIGGESIEVQRFGRLLGTVIQRDISGSQA
jgi:hypothetical protein